MHKILRFSILLFLVISAASVVLAAGTADLASLKQGQVIGSYTAQAVYLDPAGKPKGARFKHERGTVVDVLFFDSVPQVSVSFRAPPDDERGAPHTMEHLLFGKGAAGRRLKTLMPMRMGQHTAGTESDQTYFQFSSAAGPAEFYELLNVFLDSLVRPDFTDEEIRREVAHTVAVEESGRLKLEEAGTVYTEMVSRMEQPASILWDQIGRMLYGPHHPLARNQGGEPDEIWKLSPTDIRAFHAAHYHLNAGMKIVAALPTDWSAADFLARLDETMRRVEPQASILVPAGLPPFEPLAERAIRIGSFPSQDLSTPQNVIMGWPPVRTLGVEDKVRLDLALDLLAADQSFLSRDILDEGASKFAPGGASMSLGAQALPASYVWLQVSGLPISSLTLKRLGLLRDVVEERVLWMHDLRPGSPSLAELAEKARSRIRSRRRAGLKSMEGPPRFGERSSDAAWQRSLDQLAVEPGFAKPLGEDAALDGLLKEVEASRNPWAAALERAGMLQPPYVSAVLPDASLLERQKQRKDERLQVRAREFMSAYGLPEPQALERYRTEVASGTAAIDALERAEPRPSFLREPPLELDRIDWSEGHLPSGPRLVSTRFETPFTHISVAFDLSGVAEKDRELLPILASAIRGVGVVTASGEKLDAWKSYEKVLADIQGAEVNVSADTRGDRAELAFTAHASSAAEIAGAIGWLENYILRPDLSVQSREGLKSSLVGMIQSRRTVFQGDEESWVDNAAAAYRYQDRPLYMHTSSPFTVLRDLNRLRWRLEEPSLAEFTVIRATAAAALAAVDGADRATALKRLNNVNGEFGEYLRWELSHMPDDSWRRDLRRLIADYLDDLGRSQETIRRLQALISQILVRAGARVHVNGTARNIELAARQVDALLVRLPQGKRSEPPRRHSLVLDRLRERFPGILRPVHVALVNDSGKTGAISVSAPGSDYRARRREDLLDALALGVLAGGGGHSLYMRTWSAGLAYGNGISQSFSTGKALYYADKCPDPVQTLRFVDDIASSFDLDNPSLLEYSLADAFDGYRASQDISTRGTALADDLEVGDRPEVVHAFKTALLRLAREPGTLAAVRARFHQALGRVLVGLPGGRVSSSPAAAAFFVGPETLIGRYETFVRERGEATRVIRLYPRDFWP